MKDAVVIAFVAMMAVVLAFSIATVLTGCSHSIEMVDGNQIDDGRFVSDCPLDGHLVTDTETGVQYLCVLCANGGGITVLVDADGNQIVKEGA